MTKVHSRSTAKTYVIIGLAVLALAASLAAAYFYNAAQRQAAKAPNSVQGAIAQDDAIIAKVDKLIDVPSDERPKIAVVQDAGKLGNSNPFYKDAKNGDYVLFYTTHQRAIIYRERSNQIVTDQPLSIVK